jgi:hypothetical protein
MSKLRLAEIDTPRVPARNRRCPTSFSGRSQPCASSPAAVMGRTVGCVYVDGRNVNAEMVRAGTLGFTRNTQPTASFTGLNSKQRRRNAACGRCRKPKGCRLGNGARRNGAAPRPATGRRWRPPLSCGEPMRLIAFVTDTASITRILAYLGEPAQAPHIAHAARVLLPSGRISIRDAPTHPGDRHRPRSARFRPVTVPNMSRDR